MPGFWDYLKNMFKEAEESSPSQPLIHELIERSGEERERYERWKDSLVKRRLIDWLSDQYAIYLVAPEDIDEALDFLNTPSSKGFVIHFHQTNYSRQEITYLFDYLKEQVLKLNYKSQISDLRTYNRKDWVETTERHYLKPRPEFKAGEKMDQAFGNITIELEMRNDQVHNLRLRATSYQDRVFHEAEDFQGLMQAVLS